MISKISLICLLANTAAGHFITYGNQLLTASPDSVQTEFPKLTLAEPNSAAANTTLGWEYNASQMSIWARVPSPTDGARTLCLFTDDGTNVHFDHCFGEKYTKNNLFMHDKDTGLIMHMGSNKCLSFKDPRGAKIAVLVDCGSIPDTDAGTFFLPDPLVSREFTIEFESQRGIYYDRQATFAALVRRKETLGQMPPTFLFTKNNQIRSSNSAMCLTSDNNDVILRHCSSHISQRWIPIDFLSKGHIPVVALQSMDSKLCIEHTNGPLHLIACSELTKPESIILSENAARKLNLWGRSIIPDVYKIQSTINSKSMLNAPSVNRYLETATTDSSSHLNQMFLVSYSGDKYKISSYLRPSESFVKSYPKIILRNNSFSKVDIKHVEGEKYAIEFTPTEQFVTPSLSLGDVVLNRSAETYIFTQAYYNPKPHRFGVRETHRIRYLDNFLALKDMGGEHRLVWTPVCVSTQCDIIFYRHPETHLLAMTVVMHDGVYGCSTDEDRVNWTKVGPKLGSESPLSYEFSMIRDPGVMSFGIYSSAPAVGARPDPIMILAKDALAHVKKVVESVNAVGFRLA